MALIYVEIPRSPIRIPSFESAKKTIQFG